VQAEPAVATQSQKPAWTAPQLPEQQVLPVVQASPGWPQLPASGMGAQSPPWQTPRQQSPETLHACPSEEQLQPAETSQLPEQRVALAAEGEAYIGLHRGLWVERYRSGGLDDSTAWFEHLLDCYRRGTAEQSWFGPFG
jgi:hypothetical protein